MPLDRALVSERYKKLFDARLSEITSGNAKDRERDAQKFAIKNAVLGLFEEYPDIDKKEIWNHIYAAHIERKTGVSITPAITAEVISADQSWKKSGGHAFEEAVADLCNQALVDSGVTVYLQRDLKKLLDSGEILNDEREMGWLQTQMKKSTFDLYAVSDSKVFGCIQAKTSIRDRVTRDREPSIAAMDHFFWSIMFVLDGDFLKLPKFQEMVYGGAAFEGNGWHTVYALSLPEGTADGRIFKLTNELSPFREHAIQAVRQWRDNRQWLNRDWLQSTPE